MNTVRRYARYFVPFGTFALGLWLGWQANSFLAVDICLDRGGMWDYQTRACDYGRPD